MKSQSCYCVDNTHTYMYGASEFNLHSMVVIQHALKTKLTLYAWTLEMYFTVEP